MYLTQAELETVFDNIRRLLLEFGGKWITVDNELAKAEKEALAAVTTGMPHLVKMRVTSSKPFTCWRSWKSPYILLSESL